MEHTVDAPAVLCPKDPRLPRRFQEGPAYRVHFAGEYLGGSQAAL